MCWVCFPPCQHPCLCRAPCRGCARLASPDTDTAAMMTSRSSLMWAGASWRCRQIDREGRTDRSWTEIFLWFQGIPKPGARRMGKVYKAKWYKTEGCSRGVLTAVHFAFYSFQMPKTKRCCTFRGLCGWESDTAYIGRALAKIFLGTNLTDPIDWWQSLALNAICWILVTQPFGLW